jgi:hypothetical protein
MIQTKSIVLYNARDQKSGIIRIEVTDPVNDSLGGIKYTVKDWFIDTSGSRTLANEKPVLYSAEQINNLDAYIEGSYPEILGLSKIAREREKIKIALMLDTQTNVFESGKTIYGLTPDAWEFTPEE